jgi:broad specificity phosphatase PhoE
LNVFKEPNRRRIYLLRHAEAAYLNADGTPVADTRAAGLTPNGESQARRQAEVLAQIEFDRAVCSGLPRTRATAAIILAGRSTPPLEILPDLEEIRGGDRHQPVEDLERWIRHVANPWADAAHPDARFLGGERFTDFQRRVVPAFSGLIDDRSWHTLFVVAHGGVNRLILNHVMNLPWQGAVSIEQDACCINIVDVDVEDGAPVRYLVRGINITGYNLNKAGIMLTDMERTAQRLAALAAPQR